MPGAYLEFAERLALPHFAHLPVCRVARRETCRKTARDTMLLAGHQIRVADRDHLQRACSRASCRALLRQDRF